MPFQSKKIKIETLGEYLLGTRKHLRLSIADVSASTGVSVKFLEFLESGQLHLLPPTVYVAGFLRELSRVYRVPTEALVNQFKKERALSHEISRERLPASHPLKKFFNKLVITPKFLSLGAGLLFILITVAYIVVEVLSIYGTPSLVIAEPRDGQKITNSTVTVSGHTDPGTVLEINNQPVLVESKDGSFHTVVSVTSGQKDLVFVASNKFNKSNTKTVSLLVDTKIAEKEAPAATQQLLKLVLNFTESVNIVVTTDEGAPVSESLASGSSKIITAKNKILLSTSNAGATIAQLNNKLLGPLGKKNETLNNIPFSAESASIIVSSKESRATFTSGVRNQF